MVSVISQGDVYNCGGGSTMKISGDRMNSETNSNPIQFFRNINLVQTFGSNLNTPVYVNLQGPHPLGTPRGF